MSPRKMLSPFLFVLFLSLAGGTALAATNKENCDNGGHDFCWETAFCNSPKGQLQKSYIKDGSPTWYGCESYDAASARNRNACNAFCNGYKNPTEDPRNPTIYCDACRAHSCGPALSYPHESWMGYGDHYFACEDFAAASQRNRQNCEAWCAKEETDDQKKCDYCDTLCSLTRSIEQFGNGLSEGTGIGQTWRACEENKWTRQNREKCEAWCGGEGDAQCDYCSKYVGCGVGARKIETFGGLFDGKNWHACQTYSTASKVNRANIEAFCDQNKNLFANMFCDLVSNGPCGAGTVQLGSYSVGFGDTYYACEDIAAASLRNKMRCEQWCPGIANCDGCAPVDIPSGTKKLKGFGVIGTKYSAGSLPAFARL